MAVLLPAGRPAMAQTLAVSGACAQQCGAVSRQVRDNRPEIQACLIRCNASQDYDRAAGATRPQQAPPASRLRSRPSTQAEARRAAPPAQAVPAAAARGLPYAAAAPPASSAAPPPAARGAQLAASAGGAAVAAPAGRGWGAAYLAAAPGTDFGLTVGVADRLAAHTQAQSACGARGAPCRAALEFADRCGAVAQARRTLGLFRTADPRTYSVSYAAAGSGPTREAAEGMAMDECRSRERTTGCEVVASSCGRP
ncbi:DUF4189 domain-containing protein [Dankookia sp. P2]|uniref:DUF4189 domain-containing protein n=1 Tax=Dankookia sp. P2 TaxID=3423955 RepID=UPI003D66A59B